MSHIFHRLSFLFFSLVLLGLTLYLVFRIPPKDIFLLDARAFYSAAIMVDAGVRADFYSLATQYEFQRHLFPIHAQESVMPFFNPPFVALALSPLGLFSISQAYIVMAIINVFVILLCLLLFQKEKYKNSILFMLLFFYLPLWYVLLEAQLSAFLLLGIMGSWFLLKKKKNVSAGIVLALLLIKPYFLFFPLLLLVWKKQWKIIFGFFCSSFVLLFFSWLWIGTKGLMTYGALLFHSLSIGDMYAMHPQSEPTLRGFLQNIFHTDMFYPIFLPFLLGIFSICFLFFLSWKGKWVVKTRRFDAQYAVLVLIMIITSVHTNYYDLLILFFPCVVIVGLIKNQLLMWVNSILVLFFVMLFAWYPGYFLLLAIILLSPLIIYLQKTGS